MEEEVYGAISFRRQTVICLPWIYFTISPSLFLLEQQKPLFTPPERGA
jgi:hypothetical protein